MIEKFRHAVLCQGGPLMPRASRHGLGIDFFAKVCWEIHCSFAHICTMLGLGC